jgi:hypothetical protein
MAIARKPKLDTTFKGAAALLSAGAALVSILSYMASRKTHAPPGGAAPVEVMDESPSADTAYSLGDAITTVAADARPGARATAVRGRWTIRRCAVDSTGQVVARAPASPT